MVTQGEAMAIKKQCIICKQYKGRKQFGPDETKQDGKNQVCAECIKNIKSITPITQCIMPGCEKYRQVKYLCKRHFKMWCKHEIIHPLKGRNTDRGPKFKRTARPVVPDGLVWGTCQVCGFKGKIKRSGSCKKCKEKLENDLAGEEYLYFAGVELNNISSLQGIEWI